MNDVIAIEGLHVDFRGGESTTSALSDVWLAVRPGEILGLAGESGCGKSTLAQAVMGLLPSSAEARGRVLFDDVDLLELDDESLARLRGKRIGMVFQDPSTALDPCFAVGEQIAEGIRVHGGGKARARARALELLAEVGIPAPDERYGDPPHWLSGGQRQRVVVAIAVANDPVLVLADEPTTALDVTVQAQILGLLRQLRERHQTSIVLITHDLAVAAETCDRVAVLYAGQLAEVAPARELFVRPRHPYTRTLLAALPGAHRQRGALRVLQGSVPDLTNPPSGCRFRTRCPLADDVCGERPPASEPGAGHQVWCWHYEKLVNGGDKPAILEDARS